MKNKFYGFIIGFVSLVLLAGCGGGMGAPGSTGGDETGIVIRSATLSVDSPDIDTAIHACSETTVEPALSRTDATLTVNATGLVPNSADDPFLAASVEQCTITYKKANEDPGAPIIETLTVYPKTPLLSGTSSFPITLMDIERKTRWWNDFSGGVFTPAEYSTHYVAVVVCTYKNGYGTGSFQSELDIWLADFNLC